MQIPTVGKKVKQRSAGDKEREEKADKGDKTATTEILWTCKEKRVTEKLIVFEMVEQPKGRRGQE